MRSLGAAVNQLDQGDGRLLCGGCRADLNLESCADRVIDVTGIFGLSTATLLSCPDCGVVHHVSPRAAGEKP